MNLKKLEVLLKPYGIDINIQRKRATVLSSPSDILEDEYEDVVSVIQRDSYTCCGTEEFGEIYFHSCWNKLPQDIANKIVRFTFQESKKFQIIYSLERNSGWKKFNEALSATGWIPLKRWKGNGRNMIQAWYR